MRIIKRVRFSAAFILLVLFASCTIALTESGARTDGGKLTVTTNGEYARYKLAAQAISPLRFSKNIVIDGKLGEWSQLPAVDLPAVPEQVQFENRHGDKDLSARFQAVWDNDNLYLAIRVVDDIHHPTGKNGIWSGDSIQLGIGYGGKYGPEYGLAVLEDGESYKHIWRRGENTLGVESIKYAGKREGDLTIYEAAIPWQAIYKAKPENSFTMNFIVNESDEADRVGWIQLTPGIGTDKTSVKFAIFGLADADGKPTSKVLLEVPSSHSVEKGDLRFNVCAIIDSRENGACGKVTIEDGDGAVIVSAETEPLAAGHNFVSASWQPASGKELADTYRVRFKVADAESLAEIPVLSQEAFALVEAKTHKAMDALSGLVATAEAKGIPADYARAALAVSKRSLMVANRRVKIGQIDTAIRDTKYLIALCAQEGRTLRAVLDNKCKARHIPKPKLDKVEIRDGNFWVGDEPVMFIGAHVGAGADMEGYPEFGYNAVDAGSWPAVFNTVLPADGEVDRKVVEDLAERHPRYHRMNLASSLNPQLHTPPLWAFKKYPDITGGDVVTCLPNWGFIGFKEGAKEYGSFWVFAIDSVNTRRLIKQYFSELMPTLKEMPGFMMVWLMNEPRYKSQDKHYIGLYRDYLRAKYGQIDKLNTAWQSEHKTFGEIGYPEEPGSPPKFDWLTFHQDQVASWFEWLAASAREYYPNAILTNKPTASVQFTPENGIDIEREAELWEVPGCDAFRYPDSSRYAFGWSVSTMLFDLQRSIAPDKPLADLEFHYVHAPNLSAECAWACYLHGSLHGLRWATYWVWSVGVLDDRENAPDGLKHTVSSQPKTLWGTSKAALDLRRLAKYLALFPTRPEVMLYFSKPSLYGDSEGFEKSTRKAYEAANFLDTPIGFATDKMIRAGKLDALKVLIVQGCSRVETDVRAAIEKFAEEGGTVILIDESLTRNEFGRVYETPFPEHENVVRIKSGQLEELFFQLAPAFNSAGLRRPVRALTLDGKEAWAVECRTAQKDGKRVSYLFGLNNKPVKVKLHSTKPISRWHDVANDKQGTDLTFEVKPYELVLLELD